MKWTLIIILIVAIPFVIADEGDTEIYLPKEVFDLSVHVTNVSGDVIEANCSIQIQNESYNLLVNDVMNEIDGGWYNYSYNNSKTGKYFCRHNCTQGDQYIANVCDFIIEGDETMPIAIIFATICVIVIYFFILIHMFTTRTFNEHGLLKLLFLMISFWIILLPINMAMQYNDFNGGPAAITSNLSMLFRVVLYLNVLITFYWFLWFVVQLLKKMNVMNAEGRLGLK